MSLFQKKTTTKKKKTTTGNSCYWADRPWPHCLEHLSCCSTILV